MSWFDESALPTTPPSPDPVDERRRRTRLITGLVVCGVLLGLVVAGGVWAVGRYVDGTAPGGGGPTVDVAPVVVD